MNYILDNLIIGDYQEACNRPQEIESYLCVAGERDLHEPPENYHKVPMNDMCPIPVEQLREAVNFIEQNINDKKIMVFCNAGIGRAPSTVIAFLCLGLNFSFGEAVEYVARKKPYMSILPELVLRIDQLKEEVSF